VTDTTQAPERLKRLVEDAIWMKSFVRDNVGMTGYDWEKRDRAEKHYTDICSLIADLAQPPPIVSGITDGELVWTPELETARIALCEFLVRCADDKHCAYVHVDLSKRLLETEQALTILGEIAISTLSRTTDQSQ
jgi:hypothetical protein